MANGRGVAVMGCYCARCGGVLFLNQQVGCSCEIRTTNVDVGGWAMGRCASRPCTRCTQVVVVPMVLVVPVVLVIVGRHKSDP